MCISYLMLPTRVLLCVFILLYVSLSAWLLLSLSLSLCISGACNIDATTNLQQIVNRFQYIYTHTHSYTRYIYVYIVNGFKKNRSSTCIKTIDNLNFYTVSLCLCLFLVLTPSLSHSLSALPAGSPVCVRRCGGTLEGEPQLLSRTSVFVLLYQQSKETEYLDDDA